MDALGRLLVIWGALLPLLVLPSTADVISEKVAILDTRLDRGASLFGVQLGFDTVIVLALITVGLGLSCRVLARAAHDHARRMG
jgi:hypothetical protein